MKDNSDNITVGEASIETQKTPQDLAPILDSEPTPLHNFNKRALSVALEAKFLNKQANSDLFAPVKITNSIGLSKKRKSSVQPSLRNSKARLERPPAIRPRLLANDLESIIDEEILSKF